MIQKDSTRDGPGIYRHNILRSKSYAGWIMRMDSGHHAERLGLLEFPNEETPFTSEAMMLRLCRLHDKGDADLPHPSRLKPSCGQPQEAKTIGRFQPGDIVEKPVPRF